MPSTPSWRLLQIADSAFPTGGFAHSCGLEAAAHLGEVGSPDRLDAYVRAYLSNVGNASLPFVASTYDEPNRVWEIDATVDAFLTNHVANRASRTQGRSFAATCARIFDEAELISLAKRSRTRDVSAHYAPIFGASVAALGLDRSNALGLYLYLALRGVASAAVRLGIVGPYESQRLQLRHTSTIDATIERCSSLAFDKAATTSPLLDIFAGTHDRLYTRLFQS